MRYSENESNPSPAFKVEWLAGYGDNIKPEIHSLEALREESVWNMSSYVGEDWEAILLGLKVGEFYDSIVVTEHVRFTRVA